MSIQDARAEGKVHTQDAVNYRIKYPDDTEVDNRERSLRRLGEYKCCYKDRQSDVATSEMNGEKHGAKAPQVRGCRFCDPIAAH